MSKSAILIFCVLCPSVVSAGEASGQFQVGITITGKRASTPASGRAAAEAALAAEHHASGNVAYPKQVRYCMAKYRSYHPATGTYHGRDGKTHRCP